MLPKEKCHGVTDGGVFLLGRQAPHKGIKGSVRKQEGSRQGEKRREAKGQVESGLTAMAAEREKEGRNR